MTESDARANQKHVISFTWPKGLHGLKMLRILKVLDDDFKLCVLAPILLYQ